MSSLKSSSLSGMSTAKKVLLFLTILAISIAISAFLIVTKPTSRQSRAPRQSIPMVTAIPVEMGTANINIRALGTVKAVQETIIRPRIVGQVEKFGEKAELGDIIKKDDLLVQLDSAIYQNALKSAQSNLAKVQADYDLEMGQQKVAHAEVEQMKRITQNLGSSSNQKNVQFSELALRVPYLAQAKANLSAAISEVDLAKLNLDYTTIKAPYNALIIARNISLGSQASSADQLFTLVGTDEYYIEASVALDRLDDLRDSVGQKVNVVSGAGVVREGTISHSIAALNESTRMGRVLINVPDPLGLENGEPALILGDQAQVELVAGTIENAIIVPRSALHSGDIVWVAVPPERKPFGENAKPTDGNTPERKPDGDKTANSRPAGNNPNTQQNIYTLDVRPVTVAWKDTNTAYVSAGLKSGELLITSVLSSPIHGTKIQIPQAVPPQRARQENLQRQRNPAQRANQENAQPKKTDTESKAKPNAEELENSLNS